MRLLFAGTPAFALPCLDALVDAGHPPLAVYTQPDRPAGRGRRLAHSPVKQRALDLGLPVCQPPTLREAEAQAELAAWQPDVLIVVAYGLILPQAVLETPTEGCWNVHASLLPRWRGAAPIQRALLAGDDQTGVCLMQMARGLDTGPVMLSRACPIEPRETAATLHDKLAALGAAVLVEGLRALLAGKLPPAQPQPDEGVTYAHKIERADAQVDWQQSAVAIDCQVRALAGWPVADADLMGEPIKLHEAEPCEGQGPAGTVLRADRHGLEVACGQGALRLLRLQRPGGRVLDAQSYLNARQQLRQAPRS
ncbi:MAG: methionyl-tRNA formyltransferase [Xanthomonadales bacterium]|nr:methionyl-tRNA formyltransferase [Xanthomonadales bacterium]